MYTAVRTSGGSDRALAPSKLREGRLEHSLDGTLCGHLPLVAMELGSVVRYDRFVMFELRQRPYSSTSSSNTISAPSPLRGPSFNIRV